MDFERRVIKFELYILNTLTWDDSNAVLYQVGQIECLYKEVKEGI